MGRLAQLLPLALALACASPPELNPRYRPTENVLEVIAVLRRHIPDDTYRFEPARDFTGRNVYRSSLLRLENIERAYTEALRAGHMDGALAFAKARSLERVRAYDLAAEQYRMAAELEPELKQEALRSADVCLGIARAAEHSLDVNQLEGSDLVERIQNARPEDVLEGFEKRVARLEELLLVTQDTHHQAIVREEVERADVERARYFVSLRKLLEDGDVRAVAELQRVASLHRDSKLASRHLLSLADLYSELSEEYVDVNPPEGVHFDPVRFQDLVDAGVRVYEMVASRDGTPEKIEASRRLEAFLAFSLRVDRDRFTP